MKILYDQMQGDTENLIERVRGVYGFKVRKSNGDEGYWVINAKTGKGTIEYNGKCMIQIYIY